MIDAPRIIQVQDQLTAVIHLVIPRSEIQTVMAPGRGELQATLAAQHIVPSGPWFSHHFRMHPDTFDFEIGLPVPSPVVAAGRVTASHLPAALVARTIFRGPYMALGGAWGEFDQWLRDNGHVMRAELWESYIVGPESGADPASFQTELTRPLVT